MFEGYVNSATVAFVPSGKALVSVGFENSIHRWDLPAIASFTCTLWLLFGYLQTISAENQNCRCRCHHDSC
ncbi:MAG: hypothetical protein HC925_03970 [Coleofasciculaceae cyanobacterium SM2_3_26]|nr:hypothetical protein [Coleofasciculaceae cyanobacterium SM2_3_26]